eukprot:TRINITY_DN41992_c0_g1_i1.p1 TRINITY_DN41992_c0_g1~~TRINITY_DN41992_c0_g1_i1.p1  ORF type:complete len:760 (-),score=83.33 TRINITY_DN41992_c0_g1_i1:310-2589(-)
MRRRTASPPRRCCVSTSTFRQLLAGALPVIAASVNSSSSASGNSKCPCITLDPSSSFPDYVRGGQLAYRPGGDQTEYLYPLTYGSTECKTHDAGLQPLCNQGSRSPSWCAEKWCYVDRAACSFIVSRSAFFPEARNLYYSYATCSEDESSNSFDGWLRDNTDISSAMMPLLSDYLEASRLQVETALMEGAGGDVGEVCTVSTTCACADCWNIDAWGTRKVDLYDVGVWQRQQDRQVACLSRAIAATYRKVAAKEGDASGSRIGYQYFGDQKTGSYVGWPNVQWCPSSANDFDSRYRPWYSAGSTGPKDVVIVIDVSGSMGGGRDAQAKAATKAILDTLVWRDFATIIQFDGGVVGVFSKTLVPVTDAQRTIMHAWVDRSDGARGGTNFYEPLLGTDGEHPGAFKVIADSIAAGRTSFCQKIIMFLTDGFAAFSDDDFKETRRLSSRYDVRLFSYGLGFDPSDSQDGSVPKRLACENGGIFYAVPDDKDLATIMAGYYAYFATGQQICEPSYILYNDVVTRTELVAGCLSMYDRRESHADLLGVTCLDINVIANMTKLRVQKSWRDSVSKMSDATKQCRPLLMSDCLLQKLRADYSSSSVCGSSSVSSIKNAKCPCVDPACQDDPDFIDELGYFCDTWIGDDCAAAGSQWGMSSAGVEILMGKCKRSCGYCKWLDPCPHQHAAACAETGATPKSRACRTDKVSGVDLEGCYMSCGDPTSDRYKAERNCDTMVSGTHPKGWSSLNPCGLTIVALALVRLFF